MTPDQGQKIIELLEDILTAIKANGTGGGAKNAAAHSATPKNYAGWRAVDVPPFIKRYAGQKLGDMAAKDLQWWAENYTPKEWKGSIPQRDVDFKAALVEGAADPSLESTAPAPKFTPKPKPAAPTEADQANQGGAGSEDFGDVPFNFLTH